MTLPLVDIDRKWCEWSRSHSVRRYMLEGELEMLLALINSVQPSSMIEFGVNEGITALAVLVNFPDIDQYVGVDVEFDHQLEIPAQQYEVPKEPGRLVNGDMRFKLVLRNGSDDNITGLFDVAFIDGDHGKLHVLKDYMLAKSLVRSGGIIIFHDYTNPTVEVTEVLDDLYDKGTDLKHVDGTWLAFEYV
jgi:predicted O-methyltransferase YrrM